MFANSRLVRARRLGSAPDGDSPEGQPRLGADCRPIGADCPTNSQIGEKARAPCRFPKNSSHWPRMYSRKLRGYEALVSGDAERARAVIKGDRSIDHQYRQLRDALKESLRRNAATA